MLVYVWVSHKGVPRHFRGPVVGWAAVWASCRPCLCVSQRAHLQVPGGVCFLSPESPDRPLWDPVVTEKGASFHSSWKKKKKKKRKYLLGMSEHVGTGRWQEPPLP